MSLIAILLCSGLVVNVGVAAAYFSSTGAGKSSTQAATINPPSGVNAVQSGTNATVSWSAATVSGGGAVQGYKVTRSDGAVICGGTTLVTSLSCTDSSVPSGTYTYSVDAVYNSWDASAASATITILTAPSISSKPANPADSASASFSFSGGNGAAYQCKLDSGSYAACTSPASYASLSQGSHTFSVEAANGGSTGPATSYTWTVDTIAPTQSLALGSGSTGAYLSGTNLYYRDSAAGSLKLVDTVTDSGTGPASATFPSIGIPGWTHSAETVTSPSGGPYVSSTISWLANATPWPAYTVTGADAAGNTVTTTLTPVNDSTAPTGGALTVNGTTATSAGSTSQINNSTNFTIGSRTDYTDSGSGLKSSVLTVRSESLAGSTCGAPGSGGPFTTATTITGATQPSGITAGYCYVYTLTGTDNVGNTASISTTVVDNAVSFQVSQPSPATATAGTSFTVTLTAIKNGAPDSNYPGSALTWSGASNSPTGIAPTLPTAPTGPPSGVTWTNGAATFNVTLTDAVSTTLGVTDGTRTATFSPIMVSSGAPANLAWTSPTSSDTPLPTPCFYACAFGTGFGNSGTFTAYVSLTDADGNVASGLGTATTVSLSVSGKGSVNPASLTIPATGPATTSTEFTYTSKAKGNFNNETLTASATGYASAMATFSK